MSHASHSPRHDAPCLLSPCDPDPVEVVRASGTSLIFLLCEHAGRAVPANLAGLGLDGADMDRHIAWDIGAAATARRLSDLLDAPLVLQRYSRLVIDTNRPLSAPDCIPEISDGTMVPGNAALDAAARAQRYDEIHRPLHDTVAEMLDARAAAGRPSVLVTIHSYTPVFAGQARPMSVGFLYNRDARLAQALKAALTQIAPDDIIALNAPYAVDDDSDYAIPIHGERRGIPHALIELRNDLISNTAGQRLWAVRLAEALGAALETLEITP
ncbi:N-formylglutamate amidohydrolase [Roseovarius sp. M141]|uniref:N-formylglutamate amidohydrolase n=1 Tax=Roseovarius sp. M141 TaxID=2583806 RepID=UPI0020CF0936|nr:N-formylglutamate amidohydrolase [Roseovarius sp. M141]MCQ0093574.1 N-formylglutamate amidohydrolase [Roseovarius sp. M141]